MTPPIPADDDARVKALRSLGVLDTPPELDYEELTQLAAQVCQVPMAVISLVDADRQWFKSRVGLGSDSTPRQHSFCAHAICEPQQELFVVPDALADARTLLGAGNTAADEGRAMIADGLVAVPEGLIQEADLLEPLAQLALDDLGTNRLWLLGERLVSEERGAIVLGAGPADDPHRTPQRRLTTPPVGHTLNQSSR